MTIADGHILAEGLTPGMVFGIAVFVLWVFGSIMGKKKPSELKKPSREAQDLAEVRRRIREQQNAQKPAITPRIEQLRAKNQQKQQRKQKAQQQKTQPHRPPALPAARVIQTPPPLADSVSAMSSRMDMLTPAASTQEIGAAPVARRDKSETAKNIRLLLQKSGVKEAFVLGEVLGRPKALQGS